MKEALAAGCTVLIMASAAAADVRREAQFKADISAENIGSYIRKHTERPNYPGAPYAQSLAEQTLAVFKQWGWDARIVSHWRRRRRR